MRNFVKDLFSKTEVNAIGAARGPVGKKINFCLFHILVLTACYARASQGIPWVIKRCKLICVRALILN